MDWKTWLKGLLAASLGGAAAAASQAAMTPGANGKQIGAVAATGALIALAGYLKQSPLK